MSTPAVTGPGWAGRYTGLPGPDATGTATGHRWADREAALDAVHRLVWAYDDQDVAALTTILDADIEWEVLIAGSERAVSHRGRDDVLRWIAASMADQREQRRHVLANPRVVLVGTDRAEVLATFLLFSTGRAAPGLAAAGFYRVGLVSRQRSWHIIRILSGFDADAQVLG